MTDQISLVPAPLVNSGRADIKLLGDAFEISFVPHLVGANAQILLLKNSCLERAHPLLRSLPDFVRQRVSHAHAQNLVQSLVQIRAFRNVSLFALHELSYVYVLVFKNSN